MNGNLVSPFDEFGNFKSVDHQYPQPNPWPNPNKVATLHYQITDNHAEDHHHQGDYQYNTSVPPMTVPYLDRNDNIDWMEEPETGLYSL